MKKKDILVVGGMRAGKLALAQSLKDDNFFVVDTEHCRTFEDLQKEVEKKDKEAVDKLINSFYGLEENSAYKKIEPIKNGKEKRRAKRSTKKVKYKNKKICTKN